MQHIAIDLGGTESQVCVREPDGSIVLEERLFTRELETFLAARPPSRVVCETCAEAAKIAEGAKRAGHEVRVVPATMVRTLGVGHRGIKTDKRDARILSEVSCRIDVPSVHLKSNEHRDTKTVIGMRDALVGARTQLINTVRGWLRTQLIRIPSGEPPTFCARVQHALESEVPAFVQRQLDAIEALNAQIKAADAEIATAAKANPICQRLMTVPGVGPLTASLFVATVDDVERFPNAQQFQSYLGLTPGENSSSTRVRRTSITKAGPADLRRLLNQGCWSVFNSRRRPPLARWGHEIARRRGRPIAITAMCRKLSGILYAVWRDGTTYDSKRVTGLPPTRMLPVR